jgi:hypothetical protein
MSENKLTGSLGARNEINVDIIGTGARGKDGRSAYQIWLDLGNAGTEQDFIDSLGGDEGTAGASAYEVAVDNGFAGTEAEWLASLVGATGSAGADGADGADGKSVELQKTDTHIQWRLAGEVAWSDIVALAEIKGDKGDTGAAGYTPIRGTDYWTAADQASIVADVLAALPDGDEVDY